MIGPIPPFPAPLKLALIPNDTDPSVEVCNGCNEATRHVGEDGISVCSQCGVCEGDTRMVTEAEYERLNT